MADISRLNGAIRVLEQGKPAFVTFSPPEISAAQAINAALNPKGEILVVIMCEEVRAIKNLPKILEEVPGIGVVLIGEGDLSQDMGYPRQYDHPAVASAIDEILAICKQHKVACGHPHVDSGNVDAILEKGFRWLMPAPTQSFSALERGLKISGRP